MKPKPRKGRPALVIGRQPSTFTLDPRTTDRLTELADASGLSRGRIVDLGVASLTTCRQCAGIGYGDDDQTCEGCRGARIVTRTASK